jgi:hypothetical protein
MTATEDWLESKNIANNGDITAVQFKNDYNKTSDKSESTETKIKYGTDETIDELREKLGVKEKPEDFRTEDYLKDMVKKYKDLYPDPDTKPLEDADKNANRKKNLFLLGEALGLIAQTVSAHGGGIVPKRDKTNVLDKIDLANQKVHDDYRSKLLANQKLRNDAMAKEIEYNNDKAKANAAHNKMVEGKLLDILSKESSRTTTKSTKGNEYGSKEVGQVASSGKGGAGGSGVSGDKFQVIPAKDSKGNNIVYEFNIGKHNANALLSAFINEIKNKNPELNLDKVAGGANIRSLINSINAQTDPEAKSQIIANFITNTINDPVYKDVALQVLDEMNASGVYEGILYRRGKENKPPQNANKPNINDAFEEEETEEDYEFQ